MIGNPEQESLARELAAAATAADRRAVVERFSRVWGVSEKTVYRHARSGGWTSGRKPRADAGTLSTLGPSEEDLMTVANYLTSAKRRKKKPPVAKAIRDCESAGKIPPGLMQPHHFYRWAKGQNLDWRGDWTRTRMRDTHVNLASPHPNFVHEIDASVYAYWYVKPSGGLDCRNNEKTNYKNKPNDEKVRIIRWIVCDHCTNAFYVRYTTDEKVVSLAEVLYHAWQRKENCDVLPFCGVPKHIYWDLHGTHWSEEIQHLLSALGVECLPSRPHQPRSHGSVETLHGLWERWFELDQGFDPPASLDELQSRADDACAYLNSERIHTRMGKTRSDGWHGWIAANAAELRLPVPWEIFRRLVQRADERVVGGDGRISFEGRTYRLPRDLWSAHQGERVRIHVSPFREGWIDVHVNGSVVCLPAVALDEWGRPADSNVIGSGEIKASPASPREKKVREIRERTDIEGVGKHKKLDVSKRYDAVVPPMTAVRYEEPPELSYGYVQARRLVLENFDQGTLSEVQRALLAERLAADGTYSESEIQQVVEMVKKAG